MFAVAFEQPWIERRLVDFRILVVVFVFDSQLLEIPMDSVETLS
jgi:hypothetical protein